MAKPFQCWIALVSVWAVLLTDYTTNGKKEITCEGINQQSMRRKYIDQKYSTCTVVEGNVTLVITDASRAINDSTIIQFPKVREITGLLLIFQMRNVVSLEQIFPELRVIRGNYLFGGYSLIIYQNPHLREIGLPHLKEITHGGVRIIDNPELCFADSLNWSEICHDNNTPPYIMRNMDSINCPNTCQQGYRKDCALNPFNTLSTVACWNNQTCQQICPSNCSVQNLSCSYSEENFCCHSECIGGCSGQLASDCNVCRHVTFEGECRSSCPVNYYKVFERRCVTREQCYNITGGYGDGYEFHLYKVFEDSGTCDYRCPLGFEQNPANKRACVKCKKTGCSKKCYSNREISTLANAEAFKGCNIMFGHLEITINDKLTENETDKLEEYLGDLREVHDYVFIWFSPSITSLKFLKNLQLIRGNSFHALSVSGTSLSIVGNANLVDLWNFTKNESLLIERGAVQIQNNPILCYQTIRKTFLHIQLPNGTNMTHHQISSTSNGRRAICEVTQIELKAFQVVSTSITLLFESANRQALFSDEVLSFLVYYMEVKSGPGTKSAEIPDEFSEIWKISVFSKYSEVEKLSPLKPSTRYAIFARIFTVNSFENPGERSKVIFVRTAAEPFSIIKNESFSPQSIYLEWSPPLLNVVDTIYLEWPEPMLNHVVPNVENRAAYFMINFTIKPDKLQENQNFCEQKKKKSDLYDITVGRDGPVTTDSDSKPLNVVASPDPFDRNILRGAFSKSLGERYKRSQNLLSLNLTRPMPVSSPSRLWSSGSLNQPVGDFIKLSSLDYNFTMNNLKHFTTYEFKILACFQYYTSMFCLPTEIVGTKRTMPIESKDAINETSISYYVSNDGLKNRVFLRWEAPIDPNGAILLYEIEYAIEASSNKPNLVCVSANNHSRSGGFLLDDLSPGQYRFRVRARSLAQYGPWTNVSIFEVEELKNVNLVTTVSVSFVGSLILAVSGVIIGIYLYRRYIARNFDDYANQFFSVNPDYLSQLDVYNPDEWECKREDIDLIRELGSGAFGKVYEGFGRNLLSVCGVKFGACAVKTVGEKATIFDRFHFLVEASVMKEFCTAHIVKLFGVVSLGQPALIVMELMNGGSLKEYLISRRPAASENEQRSLKLSEVLQMAGEIADGMAYLEAKRFCHRDLAARNCMVSDNGVCKIGDFGMARDTYGKGYYRSQRRRLLPVRWMSPEALKDGKFTSKSDVWSYGVVLWEIVTLASQPYPCLSNEEVLSFVVDARKTMNMPTGSPERLYEIMLDCWRYDPRLRPSFEDIVKNILPDLSESFRNISFYCTQRGQPLFWTKNVICRQSMMMMNEDEDDTDYPFIDDCNELKTGFKKDNCDKEEGTWNTKFKFEFSNDDNTSNHSDPLCKNNRKSDLLMQFRRNTIDFIFDRLNTRKN